MKNQDFKPCGYMTITNSYGALIELDNSGEMARLAFQNAESDNIDVRRWQRIKGDNHPYVVADKRRYLMERFMRF